MKRPLLFTAFIAACSSAPPSAPRQLPPPPPRPIDAAVPVPDAPPPPPPQLGDRCERTCVEGLVCVPGLQFPNGYCTAPCGATGVACNGVCVESGKMGEVCMKPCAKDSDCRASEGYTCDPQWHACAVPNFAAIVPKTCKGVSVHDDAFKNEEMIGTAPGVYQFEPAATVLPDGNIIAMYITRGSIFEGNALGVSAGKTHDQPFKTDKQSHFDPWVARDRTGTVHAVWYGFDGRDQNGEIAHATTRDGVTWTKPVAVHDPQDCKDTEGECLDKPMLAIGPDPKARAKDIAYVMYSADDAGLRVRPMRGDLLGAPVTALAGIYGNAVVGSDGRLHIVALNGGPLGAYGSADQKVEYTVSSDAAASFAQPITVSAPGDMLPFFFSNPSIAVDDARHWIYVAYVRGGRDAVWDLVIAASKDGGKTWKRTAIGDGCAIHMVPNLALDARTGTLHLAYYDNVGGPRFAHATCTPGAAKCTVKGAINVAPFAALSTERHASKWIGEYESLVIDDKRRVLHAVWSQPIDVDGKPIARIFHATASLGR